jgi:hypothetical protein
MTFSARGLRLLVVCLTVAAAGPAMAQDPEHAIGTITVSVDQATLVRLPDKVATIVVGNPLIADVSVQASGLMVVTGKGYGATNVMALDRGGAVLLNTMVQVQGPRDNVVVVQRGMERETYSCQPRCERRITLGDGADYFNATISQVGNRNGQAQGAAPAAQGPPR